MKKKLLFLSNHLAFFVSHRLNIFFEAKKRKYDFLLVTGKQSSKHMESIALKKIKSYDLTYKVLDLKSYKFDLFNDSMSLIKFYTIIKKYKPDIIHMLRGLFSRH